MSTQDNSPYALSDEAWQAFLAVLPDTGDTLGAVRREAVTAAVRVSVQRVQAHVEDMGVRAARANSWCGVFGRTMSDIFPDGPLDGDDWRDSDGRNCRNEKWYDSDGFDRDGFDVRGYDRDGYDRDGRDLQGFDRDGKDADGVHRDDPAQYRFDANGYGRDGFHHTGHVLYGLTRTMVAEQSADTPENADRFKYNRAGFDVQGFNSLGFDVQGYNRAGYNTRGRDRDGYNAGGWNRSNEHRETGTRWDPQGFDIYGIHKDTGSSFDPDGYDCHGHDRRGNLRPAAEATVTD